MKSAEEYARDFVATKPASKAKDFGELQEIIINELASLVRQVQQDAIEACAEIADPYCEPDNMSSENISSCNTARVISKSIRQLKPKG